MKIAWISSPGLMDTDIYIVPELSKHHELDWYVIRRKGKKLDFEAELTILATTCNIIDINIGERLRNIETYRRFVELANRVANKPYDAIYIEFGMMPYYIPVMAHRLNLNKTILAIHNVHILNGGNNMILATFFTKYAIKKFVNFNVFSKNQLKLLKEQVQNKVVYFTPFMTKDYGTTKEGRTDTCITFGTFGNIVRYKRIDVLIQAAELVYSRTKTPFRVLIAGSCPNWGEYEKLIKHKEIFDLRIQRIPNEEIPKIFNEIDYYVMPYQDIAQSGAMMVAINYDKPIIASDLEPFNECISEGYNGMFFKTGDAEDLARVMIFALNEHDNHYSLLRENQQECKRNQYSKNKVIDEYENMFAGLFRK